MAGAPNVPKDVKFAIYFNILGIVVLEEPSDYFDKDAGQKDANALGVEDIVEYEDKQDDEEEEGEDGHLESAGEALKENIL